ncbi:g7970 [Coccomyxa viridis]|uniref:G7970 protein n=1 Tax=Coccomyxa viridis TaxID=1274662 RepID=A0ABP1G3P4_9CHLO
MATEGYTGEDSTNKWVYIKVKRRKSTFFVHIDLSETISEVKAKLQELVEKEPKEIKLYKDGTELPDSSTLAESKAENGDTIAMAFALPGETGKFEEPDITPHDADLGN